MKINLLIIADSLHYDYGLLPRQSYIDQFILQLERKGNKVAVTYHTPLSLCTIVDVLQHVPLQRYDLIILQIANRHLRSRQFTLRPTLGQRLREYLTLWSLQSRALVGQLGVLRNMGYHFTNLLEVLRFQRHKVILLTPFPHREPVSRWLRRKGAALIRKEGEHRGFGVFDTQALIKASEEFFLTDDRERLNAVSHELIGRRLYDFCRTEPTILSINLNA